MFLLLDPPDRLLCLSLGGPDRTLILTDKRTQPGGGSLRCLASSSPLANSGVPQRWSPVQAGSPPLTHTAGLVTPEPASPGLDDGGLTGDGGSTPDVPAATGVSPTGTRRSPRLAGVSVVTALDRAMTRKVCLAEGAARNLYSKAGKGNMGKSSKLPMSGGRKIRRIVDKSALCGISLSYDDACSVSTFTSGPM